MEAVTPHLFALSRGPATTRDARREKKGKCRRVREPGIQSAFNIDSNPISWISIFVIYFLHRRRQRYTICTGERGICFSKGQRKYSLSLLSRRCDVALSSSIKFRSINKPSSRDDTRSLAPPFSKCAPTRDFLQSSSAWNGERAFRLFISITVSQWTRRNSVTTKVPARRGKFAGKTWPLPSGDKKLSICFTSLAWNHVICFVKSLVVSAVALRDDSLFLRTFPRPVSRYLFINVYSARVLHGTIHESSFGRARFYKPCE